MPAASRKDLRDASLQKTIAVPRRSFESSLMKKVAALRGLVASRRTALT
jgi:hypothetical protein